MLCDEARELLLNFEWDEEERARVERALGHIESCGRCRSVFHDYDDIRRVLRPSGVEAEPAGGWTAFEERLVRRPVARRRRWFRLTYVAASVLLAGMIGIVVGRVSAPSQQVGQPGPIVSRPANGAAETPDRKLLAYSREEIEARTKAFESVSEVFDRQAGWILISDKGSDVGLSASPGAGSKNVLVLRLVLSDGKRVASQADLVIVPGETANATIPFEKGQQLRYCIGTSKGNSSKVTVWVEVQKAPGGGEWQAALAAELPVGGGEVMPAGRIVTSGGRYDLDVAISQVGGPERGT